MLSFKHGAPASRCAVGYVPGQAASWSRGGLVLIGSLDGSLFDLGQELVQSVEVTPPIGEEEIIVIPLDFQ
jgi:hypothetical protein